jgi:hypothetical protein
VPVSQARVGAAAEGRGRREEDGQTGAEIKREPFFYITSGIGG